jgi:hypothetical protein
MDTEAPQTRILEKRRQMFEIEEALEAQKEEYARREVRAPVVRTNMQHAEQAVCHSVRSNHVTLTAQNW